MRISAGNKQFALIPKGQIAEEYWCGFRFENKELEFVLDLLKPDMTFFDIGANVGLYSIPCAMKVGRGKVYSFEPCSWTCELLKQNIALNRLENVVVTSGAVADYEGECCLQLNKNSKDGLNTMGQASHPDAEVIGRENAKVLTLDGFVDSRKIKRIDLMKVDVEGAELMVFTGAQRLLSSDDAPVVFYESFEWCTEGFAYHPVEIMWLLKECGYRLYVFDRQSGRAIERDPSHGYNAMMVAVKPEHPLYPEIQSRQP